MSSAIQQAQEKLLRLFAALPLLLVAIGIVLGFALIGRWLARRLHLFRWGSDNPYLDSLLRRGIHLAALLIGVLIALDLLGATALVGAVLGSAGVLLNYTRNPMRRLQFTLGIGTGEDLNEVRRLGVETMRNIPAIATNPEPQATIRSVGDSSVLIDFFAWIDQREVDFFKTRSEAIRQVKCAIEDQDMDMPEPIYRVQLTSPTGESEAVEGGVAAPRLRKPRVPEEVQPDVSVNHDLDMQVAGEQATHEGENLLQHPAPKE